MKRVLITGSNRGLGWDIAMFFNDNGWEVLSLNKTLKNIKWLNEIKCDLEYIDQINDAFEQDERIKDIDVCIFNAATRRLDLMDQMSIEDWNASIQTNLTSVFYLLQKTIKSLRKNQGYAFFIGSQASDHKFETGVAYCSTKAALKSLVEVLIMENRNHGVRATILNAGAIKNRPKPNDEWKMSPNKIAGLIYELIHTDNSLLISELEVRPSQIPDYPLFGMDRIQAI